MTLSGYDAIFRIYLVEKLKGSYLIRRGLPMDCRVDAAGS